MADLQLESIDDLVKELQSRFDAIVISGVQRGGKEKPDRYYHFYNGGYATELGLAYFLIDEIMSAFSDDDQIDED